jgi:calcium-dependent protein kinase
MKEKSQFFNEIDILKRTDHPNIIRLFEFFEDDENFHLVLEYVSGGELFDYIIKSRHLSEAISANFMKQILTAVSYCHKNNIVHRDLKPENLLLDKEGPDAVLKVVDFGTSAIFDTKKQMTHKYGTAYYIAPEVLTKNYSEKCDLWSCGVILYILLSGRPPFYGKNDKEILRSVLEGHYSMQGAEWARSSPEAKSLVCRMLQLNPKERISAEQALNHPWILGLAQSENVNIDSTALSNLQSFHAELKLQHAILSFIAFQMVSKEEAKRLSETFAKIDKNRDGKLSHEELLEAYVMQMGKEAAVEEVRKTMIQVDVNGSGFIDYHEFITACARKQELLSKENIDSAFRILDADQSGKITASELKEFLAAGGNVNKEVWDGLIRDVDQNGDGEIDLEEFKEMMIQYLKTCSI